MTHRTYKIDVKVVEIRTYTVTVPKTPGRDDLEEAYREALVLAEGGYAGDLRTQVREAVAGSHDLVEEVKDPTIEFKNLAPAGTHYGWVITRDMLAEEDAREGDLHEDDVNACGPSSLTLTSEQIREYGVEFQMLDGDDEVVYCGFVAWAVDYKAGDGFEPLDDFGRGNAGCTEIRYRDTAGEWRTL